MYNFPWVRFRPGEALLCQRVPLQIIDRNKGLLLDKPVNPNPFGPLCPPLLAPVTFMFCTYEKNMTDKAHSAGLETNLNFK
jgi:hypothetical protein